jgi:hypothetical protein
LSLSLFDDIGWRTSEKELWVIAERLVDAPHFRVLPPTAERKLTRMDRRLFEAGMLGAVV